jgi:hypothetical protein
VLSSVLYRIMPQMSQTRKDGRQRAMRELSVARPLPFEDK